MRIEYNKLIRDRIPEIILQDGRRYSVEEMSEEEYVQALKDKLVEEAQEAARAKPEELVKELADLYEVVDSLMEARRIDQEVVFAEQRKRRQSRGGFNRRLRLLWTEEIP
jgi:predicted house-cleaning noncanonical NTP pyrophosphatase (MazG superfamily)